MEKAIYIAGYNYGGTVSRIPLQRDGPPIKKLEDLAKSRSRVEWKYKGGKPRNLGDSPEPLTDYQDVSRGTLYTVLISGG